MAVAFDAAGTEGKATVLRNNGISYTGLTIGSGFTNGAAGRSNSKQSCCQFRFPGGIAANQPGNDGDWDDDVHRRHVVQTFGLVNPVSGNRDASVDMERHHRRDVHRCGVVFWRRSDWWRDPVLRITTSHGNKYRAIGCHYKPTGNAVQAIIGQSNNLNSVSGTLLWTMIIRDRILA